MNRHRFSPEELADLIWLSAFSRSQNWESSGVETHDISTLDELSSLGAAIPSEDESEQEGGEGELETSEDKSVDVVKSEWEFDTQLEVTEKMSFSPIYLPSASALPAKLELSRALKSFKKKVESKSKRVLDEVKTSELNAELNVSQWIPYFMPNKERWLDLVIIFDNSPSMAIWQKTMLEFRLLTEQLGAFRNVQTYQICHFDLDELSPSESHLVYPIWPENTRPIDVDKGKGVALQTFNGFGLGRICPARELIDHSGRRLVAIISDCSSSGWYSGALEKLISEWVQQLPTSVIHVFPNTLWKQASALGKSFQLYGRAERPLSKNQELVVPLPKSRRLNKIPPGVPLPVIQMRGKEMKAWAEFVIGNSKVELPIYYLDHSNLNNQADYIENRLAFEGDPIERWKRFSSRSSPIAQQLAIYLANVPLQLPIMRQVQFVMFDKPDLSHLAEFLQSSLVYLFADENNQIPTTYEFEEGVRELLLTKTLLSEKLKILENISSFIESEKGQLHNFRALIANPNGEIQLAIDEHTKPFAKIASRVLQRIGGQYSLLAEELEKNASAHSKSKKKQDDIKLADKSELATKTRISVGGSFLLSNEEAWILSNLFPDSLEVVVESELPGGFSGSRLFQVRDIDKSSSWNLLSIVKIDSKNRINREFQAYQEYVHGKLSFALPIVSPLVESPSKIIAGLRYHTLGSGITQIQTLFDFIQMNELSEILNLLENRLFAVMDRLWTGTRQTEALNVQSWYDAYLPFNLKVETTYESRGVSSNELTPDSVFKQEIWEVNTPLTISGFRVVDIHYENKSLSLDMPFDSGQAYCFHISPVENIDQYELNQILTEPLSGIIVSTRHHFLIHQAKKILGSSFALSGPTIYLNRSQSRPNPITLLSTILRKSFGATMAHIHGDFHLKNVLVENQKTFVINFSLAGKNHVLRDLIMLETSIMLELLPIFLDESGRSPREVDRFYTRLHCSIQHPEKHITGPAGLEKLFGIIASIRRKAAHLLHKKNMWEEYYVGLYIHLLGSLKFASLDKIMPFNYSKQIAFLGAVAILQLIDSPVECAQFFNNPDNEKSEEEIELTIHKRSDQWVSVSKIHRGEGDIIINSDQPPSMGDHNLPRPTDHFSKYELAIDNLLQQLDIDEETLLYVVTLRDRLINNIDRTRLFGDTETRREERAETLFKLNRIALAEIGISFNELVKEGDSRN